jgi:hypothetical protein
MTKIEMILDFQPFPKELRNHSDMINAISIPIIGAKIIKLAVLTITAVLTASKPAAAIPAPAKPPIKVCEDEEGIPNHQVNKFQAIAAINPAKITFIMLAPFTASALTVLATVLATPWSLKIKKATELKMAAHSTAWKGVNTFVETTVAIELAAS